MQYIYEDGQSLSSRLPANLYNPETIFVVQVSLSPKHFRIVETENYQPVISGRLLNQNNSIRENKSFADSSTSTESTTTTTIEDRNSYYPLFVMAQIGCLYSFVKMVFKFLTSLFTENMLLMSILNKLRIKKCEKVLFDNIKRRKMKRVIPVTDFEQKSKTQRFLKSTNKNLNKFENQTKNEQEIKRKYNNKLAPSFQNKDYKEILKMKKSKFTTYKEAFQYNFKDIMYSSLWCCKPKKINEDGYNTPNEIRYLKFIDDKHILTETLDVTNLLLIQRDIKQMIDRFSNLGEEGEEESKINRLDADDEDDEEQKDDGDNNPDNQHRSEEDEGDRDKDKDKCGYAQQINQHEWSITDKQRMNEYRVANNQFGDMSDRNRNQEEEKMVKSKSMSPMKNKFNSRQLKDFSLGMT